MIWNLTETVTLTGKIRISFYIRATFCVFFLFLIHDRIGGWSLKRGRKIATIRSKMLNAFGSLLLGVLNEI